jgi:hypothetical protein
MSIIERASPSDAEATPSSDRLRVITGGRVGNMEARLGTSGFDVVAVANSEDELLIAVSSDEPDAIVVEADLCDSLERVRDLAPDAVLIVVGDHTPAGALGRIERGVSGTVMAGLLHALVAEGVGAAVVWGLVPAMKPPAAGATHVGSSLLAAKTQVIRDHVVSLFRDHAELAAAAGTLAATASVGVLLTLTMGAPRVHERADPALAPTPAAVASTSRDGGSGPSPRTPGDGSQVGRIVDGRSTTRRGFTEPRGRFDPTPDEAPPSGTKPPPDVTPSPTAHPSRPPGEAKGWDGQRPPKSEDSGGHKGWSNDVPGPDDHPHGNSDHAPGPDDHPHGKADPGKH